MFELPKFLENKPVQEKRAWALDVIARLESEVLEHQRLADEAQRKARPYNERSSREHSAILDKSEEARKVKSYLVMLLDESPVGPEVPARPA